MLSAKGDTTGDANHYVGNSVVLYRSHRLTAINTGHDSFACQIQAPDSNEVLALLEPFSSAGDALLEGQFWVMQVLGMAHKHPKNQARRPGRPPTPKP